MKFCAHFLPFHCIWLKFGNEEINDTLLFLIFAKIGKMKAILHLRALMNFYLYFPHCTPNSLSGSDSSFTGKLILIRVISCLSFYEIIVIISVYTVRFKGSVIFCDGCFFFLC